MKTATKQLADEISGGYVSRALDILRMPLADAIKAAENTSLTALSVYQAAEVAALIEATAGLSARRLTTIANSMRIEEVG